MLSTSFPSATFQSWLSSCVATSDLFAVVLLMCAETATYALAFPSCGLLNMDLIRR